MKLNLKSATFGRHETFPLRYAWLTKGVEALRKRPSIFSLPEQAMIELGVGRNMVSAIQYWLQVTGVAQFEGGQGQVTSLGEVLLGNDGDPYLEDEVTLWIIHWLIASNAELATGFFWFFNYFAMPLFREEEIRAGLTEFVERDLQLKRSQSTLKSDCSTLLRMYTPAAEWSEDHLDSPMAHLQLIETELDGRGYRSWRAVRPFIPPVALHFALMQRFHKDLQQPALPVRIALYGGDGRPAPGAVFRLSEEGLMAALAQVMDRYPHHYELRDTAGVHQIYYRGGQFSAPLEVLRRHYREAIA